MRQRPWVKCLVSTAGLLLFAGCGGGGGGAGNSPSMGPPTPSTPTTSTTPTTPSTTTPAPLAFQDVAIATLGGNTPLLSPGTTAVVGAGLTGGTLEPVGTVFPLRQSVVTYTTSSAVPADSINSAGATLTYAGTTKLDPNTGAPSATGFAFLNYELKIPALGVDAMVPLKLVNYSVSANGFRITSNAQFLNYMFAGNWSALATVPNGTSYSGEFTTGYQTPVSAVPASGQGTYSTTAPGSSTTAAGYIFPGNTNLGFAIGSISGDATITVNFADGAVKGSITNTVANLGGGFGAPWNNVGISGTLSGAVISGTTAATSVPAPGTLGAFDMSSTGTFNGALYGPTGQELGAIWSLHDPTGQGKTATGIIAATKSN